MMNDPICCELRVDTFLAVTEVKPIEPRKPRITVEKERQIEKGLEECLKDKEAIAAIDI